MTFIIFFIGAILGFIIGCIFVVNSLKMLYDSQGSRSILELFETKTVEDNVIELFFEQYENKILVSNFKSHKFIFQSSSIDSAIELAKRQFPNKTVVIKFDSTIDLSKI